MSSLELNELDTSNTFHQDQGSDESEDKEECAQIYEDLNLNDSQVSKPFIGMKFDTEDDAYNFYNAYAKSVGFSVRKDYCYKSRRTKLPIGRLLVCSKEGHKDLKLKQTSGKDVKRKRDVRENCGALLLVKVANDGKWEVNKFHEEHTHMLASQSNISLLRSHNKLSSPPKEAMVDLSSAGVGPSTIAKYLKKSGEKFVTSQQCIDYMRTLQKNNIGGECMAVLSYFEKKLVDDENFFFRIVVDENDTIKNLFWADNRSQDNCMTFGDVVVFDTTYRTNKFKMSCAPFTGVNHHRQSTLLGCALLADETEDTFTWLFCTWLECMNGKKPVCIITDQDHAMGKAINKVFPESRHIFCIWHIVKNALTHLRDLYARENFKKEYFHWIKESLSVQEFEDKWLILKKNYDIPDGHWLEHMYNKRHHWISIYFNDTFCAGMQTTQRAESINSFFDGFVNANITLSDFVYQYDLALSTRRDAEEREDFKNLNGRAVTISKSPLEIQAGKVYTKNVFSIFQEEFRNIVQFWKQIILEDSEKVVYSVYESGTDDKRRIIVEFSAQTNNSVRCSCKMFEREGILCSHALLILNENRVRCLPEQYILHRWTINARYSAAQILHDTKCTSSSGQGVISLSHKLNFKRNARKFIEMSLRSPEHLNVGISILKEGMQSLEVINKSCMDEVHSLDMDEVFPFA